MKRVFVLLLLAAVLLCGCAKASPEPYGYVYNEADGSTINLTVDSAAKTISDGRYTYCYSADGRTITVTYPNGASYYCTYHSEGELGAAGWNGDYDTTTYVDGGILVSAIEDTKQKEEEAGGPDVKMILIGLLLCGLGIYQWVAPHSVWQGKHGWAYKDAEPSDLAIGVIKAMGIIEIIAGVVVIIFSF